MKHRICKFLLIIFISIGVPCFIVGIYLPLFSVQKLIIARHDFSVLTAIKELLQGNTLLLGIVIGVFSVVLPSLKWLWMLILLIRKPLPNKYLHSFAWLSRYAMLDVFAVALIFVILQLGWIVEVKLYSAVSFFIIAVVCQLAAEAVIIWDRKDVR